MVSRSRWGSLVGIANLTGPTVAPLNLASVWKKKHLSCFDATTALHTARPPGFCLVDTFFTTNQTALTVDHLWCILPCVVTERQILCPSFHSHPHSRISTRKDVHVQTCTMYLSHHWKERVPESHDFTMQISCTAKNQGRKVEKDLRMIAGE